MVDLYDYYDSGFKIFGIHSVKNGICGCGNPSCKAFFKHPIPKNWQNTEYLSIEQIEKMDSSGHFKSGFGVLCDGNLIIDVDPRNGGNESFIKLNESLGYDLVDKCNFVVNTGGGGLHLYFKLNKKKHLRKKIHSFNGIDFLSSGFVVGASSLHASGALYEVMKGSPSRICEPPKDLIDLLEYQDAVMPQIKLNADREKVEELLSYIKNDSQSDLDYDTWISIGMILQHSLGSEGLELWIKWSSQSPKHLEKITINQMAMKFNSFGKYQDRKLTLSTLYYMATKNGYKEPVKIDTSLSYDIWNLPKVDLTKSFGLVGECAEYINKSCLFPREHLAISSALSVVGTIGGLDSVDPIYRVKPNCMFFNVAGSGTGKEAVLQAQRELLTAGGIIGCMYGSIKSEKEIYTNIIDNQLNMYLIDELGLFLGKVNNARKGGAVFLDGVLSAIMQIYSKSTGRLIIGGDRLKELIKEIKTEIANLDKLSPNYQELFKTLHKSLVELPLGVRRPFLCVSGFTTPITLKSSFTMENAINGFLARSILIEEKNDIPRRKDNFIPIGDVPHYLDLKLKALSTNGSFDPSDLKKIEETDKKREISTTDDAKKLLDDIYDFFHTREIKEYNESQLHPIVRRSYEFVLKISMILAIGDGFVRTSDHVIWAFEYIKRDLETKLSMAKAIIGEETSEKSEDIVNKILQTLDHEVPNTLRAIYKRFPKYPIEDFRSVIEHLVESKLVRSEIVKPARGKATEVYFLATKEVNT